MAITTKSISKLVTQPSFRAVGRKRGVAEFFWEKNDYKETNVQ